MLEDLERAVEAEYAAQGGSWPNNPSARDYARHAKALGYAVQTYSRAELTTWLAEIR